VINLGVSAVSGGSVVAGDDRVGCKHGAHPKGGGSMDFGVIERALPISPAARFLIASLATMAILALLDFIGAVFAKEWADTRNPLWFAVGLLCFGALFAFYANSLKTAELSIVTIGWVVFLQVGLVLYERFRYGATLAPAKWIAILLILAMQAYLVLVPNKSSGNPDTAVQASNASDAPLPLAQD
jgi:multidrug transporter EmrE-like cation transporter